MKGQIQHVFGFILVGIVIVATILLSVRLISTLSDNACEAQKEDFFERLKEIHRSYDTYGTRQEVGLRVPCQARAVCILGEQPEGGYTTNNLQVNEQNKVLLRQAAELDSETKETIYLVTNEGIDPIGRVPFETTNILCKENQGGEAQFLFEGLGFGVQVS